MRETDSTGRIYFTAIFNRAVETFEMWLTEKKLGYLEVPIVDAQASYMAEVKLGDHLDVEMSLGEIGTKSFTMVYSCSVAGKQVATAKIVHVAISEEPDLRSHLENL